MNQYIITIVPVVDDGVPGAVSQTMVRIELDGGKPTVRELTMRAPDGEGLVAGPMPYVNFELLLRAFIPPDEGDVPTSEVVASIATPAATRPTPRRAATTVERTRRAPGAEPRSNAQNSHLQTGRVYRKAPSLADLETVYTETGTISGVAEHFDVPVHTAQGWVTRMRRKNSSVTS
jgi:hypothetical protein